MTIVIITAVWIAVAVAVLEVARWHTGRRDKP